MKPIRASHATIIFFALSLLLNSTCARADDSQDGRLQKVRALTRIRTLDSFRGVLLEQNRLVTQQARCHAELEGHAVPSSCFWVLKKERLLHLIRAVREIRDVSWLEQLCIERANSGRNLQDLTLRLRAEDLPVRCKNSVQTRIADLRYQFEASAPLKLFQVSDELMENSHDD